MMIKQFEGKLWSIGTTMSIDACSETEPSPGENWQITLQERDDDEVYVTLNRQDAEDVIEILQSYLERTKEDVKHCLRVVPDGDLCTMWRAWFFTLDDKLWIVERDYDEEPIARPIGHDGEMEYCSNKMVQPVRLERTTVPTR